MECHGCNRPTDENTEIGSNLGDIESHQVGQDKEEDSDRCELNEESDDDRDDSFDFFCDS